MNLAMQQPLRYPFYMDTPRLPLSIPWSSSSPFRFPVHPQHQFRSSYPISPYVFAQQNPSLVPRPVPPSSFYTNTRYQNLKKSTSHPNRRSLHRSYDISTRSHRHKEPVLAQEYRSSRTKSISDLEPISHVTTAPLSKAHSWHAMASHRRTNLSVAYAHEMHISPKRSRKPSLQRKKPISPRRRQASASPRRRASVNSPRKRAVPLLPERGIVRIATLDEMPVPNTHTHKQTHSINNDRISTKGSISNLSTHRVKSKGNSSVKNRKMKKKKKKKNEEIETSTDTQSSSSVRSRTSLQERLNGSLRNDPLISAAMEELRQYRRSSSQNLSLDTRSQNLSRDSLHSNFTFRSLSSSSSSSSSLSTSRSHSQSSFTSLERSEIRHLIKTIKTKENTSVRTPLQSSLTSPSEQSLTTNSHSSTSLVRPKKSCITEELDRKFNTLRAIDPNQEISYVTPSSICKRKRPIENATRISPPLPTLGELLRQVQLRPIDKSTKPILPVKETKPTEEIYENPLSPIPVPRSSPIPSIEISIEEVKHEYALPMKKIEEKPRLQISHFQPMRKNTSFSKPIPIAISEKRLSRPLSMLNWFHQNSTNPILATFQPNRILNTQSDFGTASVKENIYTSDIDVYVPVSTIEKIDDDSLQIHLDNQTIRTDDFYEDYETKQPTNTSSSIINDFSHLFTRKHKHQSTPYKKNQRCSIM